MLHIRKLSSFSIQLIYLGFYFAFNTVQVILRRVVGRAEETSTYKFVRVLYCKMPTNGKQLPAFPLEAVLGIEPGLRGGRRECYHSATVDPFPYKDIGILTFSELWTEVILTRVSLFNFLSRSF